MVEGGHLHGAVVQGLSVHAKRRLPSGTHYCTTPRAKARVPRNFTCWQRAGDPGGWLAQALVAWEAGLTLEAWPGAPRGAGGHFLNPCARESHPLLPAEAEKVGRLREGGLEVPANVHLPLGEGPAARPGSALLGTGWHGGFGQVGQAGGRWMPRVLGPAEGQLGQAPAGRPGSLLSAELSVQGGQLGSRGRGAEGPSGESGRWPRWRSRRLPAGVRAPGAPTALAFR